MILFCSDQPRVAVSRVLALAVAGLLAACGGGGGSGPTATVADLQGFYAGPYGAGSAQAIVLPDGQLWFAVVGGGAVTAAGRGQASVSRMSAEFDGSVTDQSSGTTSAWSLEVPEVEAATRIEGTAKTGAQNTAVRWTYDNRYQTARPVSDFAGRWTGTASGGRVAITWDIAAGGGITGTGTTGCTYAGNLAALTPATAVLRVSVTETCPGTPVVVLSGVATLNDLRNRASLLVSAAGSNAVAFIPLEK